MIYLKKIYSSAESDLHITFSLIGFDPNKVDSTQRSFLQVLLDKGLLESFEDISTKYADQLHLKAKDRF